MFILLGVSAAIPFISYSVKMPTRLGQFLLPDLNMAPWMIGGIVYIMGAVLFVVRIPERFVQRKFDLVGSSHQIFHLMVLAGCAIHFTDSFRLYNARKSMTCTIDLPGKTLTADS